MATHTVNYVETNYFSEFNEASNVIVTALYGSISEANQYFVNRLNNLPWTDATNNQKRAALSQATRAIDRLNFKGTKTSSSQALQFPRGDDTNVPENIRIACYEIALKLLDDFDTEMEMDLLRTGSLVLDKVKETFESGYIPEHIQAGIISGNAWMYLQQYLRDPYQLTLDRIN